MAELQRKKQKSVGTICKDAIMTGISYMIPVIVGGGVITAIAKMMGGYNIGDCRDADIGSGYFHNW